MKHPITAPLLIAVTLLIVAISSFAAEPPCTIPGYGGTCGHIYKLNALGQTIAIDSTHIYNLKVCQSRDGSGACQTTSTYSEYDNVYNVWTYGNYYVFPTFSYTGQTLYLFAWNDTEHWGSSTIPFNKLTCLDITYCNTGETTILSFGIGPAPLPPTPHYPYNGGIVSPTVTLDWSSGIDSSRTSPYWPVTYDIFYKYWTFSQSEPAAWQLETSAAGIPCTLDSAGFCSKSYSSLAVGNYKWKVVAHINETSSFLFMGTTVTSTESSASSFSVGSRPRGI